MKVCVKGLSDFGYSRDLLRDFFNLLQGELQLKNSVMVELLSQRQGEMTTGVRTKNAMKVLCSDRMLIDVLRTIAHEWVHEYQHQQLGLSDQEEVQDIGGPVEDMANALAGVFMKRFQKEFPQYQQEIYSSTKI